MISHGRLTVNTTCQLGGYLTGFTALHTLLQTSNSGLRMKRTCPTTVEVLCSVLSISNYLLCINLTISLVIYPSTQATASQTVHGNETDRQALLRFKSQITQDPLGTLSLWNTSFHFCQWYGVTCNQHQRVTVLDLKSQKFTGEMSPYIANLTFLKVINLENNSFINHIPPELGNLQWLQELNLMNNSFDGEIPDNLSSCSHLMHLSLGFNGLFGTIPLNLGSLSKLVTLSLPENNLIGGIPPSLGNLSRLESLYLERNDLGGSIPDSLGQLSSLTVLLLKQNKLHGMIPPSLYNISSLNIFSMVENELYGILPQDIGLKLPYLQDFDIAMNQFSGTIPVSFSNATGLLRLDVAQNNFSGSVPFNLGAIASLQILNIGTNYLGTGEVGDLNFLISLTNCSNLRKLILSYNHFGGQLPNSIANLSTQLAILELGGNEISGSIPTSIKNLINLNLLAMEFSLLTGSIPVSIGQLQKLQALQLDGNKLAGEIPSSLGNITQLFELRLGQNYLDGSIPSTLMYCQHLQIMDLSQNKLEGNIPPEVIALSSLTISLNLSRNLLTGSLPSEVGNLESLGTLDVSHNKLSGKIPIAVGDCSSLEYLYMQRNFFHGSIPSSLASLKAIQYLDLSGNNLSGMIPKDLQSLVTLQSLNLSFNDLEGEVPTKGVFDNTSVILVTGNKRLCGGIANLKLPPCTTEDSKSHGRSLIFKVTITVVSVFLCLAMIMSFLIFYRKKKSRNDPSLLTSLGETYIRISYNEILKATDGFSIANLIGKGAFGAVYRGYLPQEDKPVAVKVLNLQNKEAGKSFMAECDALKRICHRNLLKIITSCSSIDFKGNEFKALIYEFMPNGSLENWLHSSTDSRNQSRSLNLNQRLDIAIDIASALNYLHNHCEVPIVHCDLKPSNVLLDDGMIAHVGDFGLAKFLLRNTRNFSDNASNSVAIKGSIGYIAPEYGMGGKISTKVDVYSYGILLLEMFIGKKPTDDIFINGLCLHEFARMALPDHVMDIVDSCLLLGEGEEESNGAHIHMDNENRRDSRHGRRGCLVSVIQIGVFCSMESPVDRLEIGDVVRELHLIRDLLQRNKC